MIYSYLMHTLKYADKNVVDYISVNIFAAINITLGLI